MFFPDNFRHSCLSRFAAASLALCLFNTASVWAQGGPARKPTVGNAAPAGRGAMTQDDVKDLWKAHDDALLMRRMSARGLAFEPEETWLNADLPKDTGVQPSDMPTSAAYLKSKIPPAPSIDAVTAAADALLTQAKDAAQKRDVKKLDSILHPQLVKDKSKVYVLFDAANYRGHTLGQLANEPNRQVSLQFFELTSSEVETVNYVYFATSHGKIVLRDVQSGPDQAKRYLQDEQKVAQSKLQLMFRALNDGDESGVKKLCTPGLYESIKDWGGDKHPGDRLTRGHRLDQVTVTTDVPLDQKSVRVVAHISYPLNDKTKLEFLADFERIGNDLQIVRVRDIDNKLVVYDPNMDNYLNRRYNLPDAPIPDPTTLAMTEKIYFLSLRQLTAMAIRTLQDRDKDQIMKLAQTMAESDPTSGLGQGVRAGAYLLLGKYDEAEKDATFALEHGGTVYYPTEHHLGNMSGEKFAQVVLAISKEKVQYIPAAGKGTAEDIDISSIKAYFDKPIPMTRPARPLLDVKFNGSVGGKNKGYNFAALGTACGGSASAPRMASSVLQHTPGSDACGNPPMKPGPIILGHQMPSKPDWDKAPSIYLPPNWQRELEVVLRAIQEAQGGSSGR